MIFLMFFSVRFMYCNAFLTSPGYVDLAMKTALGLREYEDVLDPADIYSLLGEYQDYLPCIVKISDFT